MIRAFYLREIKYPLQKFGKWSLKWGQVPFPILLGLILGQLIVSPAREFIISLTGIVIYFIAIVANPLGGLLLWAISYPFTVRMINISLGDSIPDLTVTRFCFAFLTAILLAQTATGRRNFPQLRGAEVAALLFVVGMGLSVSAAADPTRAMQVVTDAYLTPVLAYFLARNLILERRDLDKLLSAFLIIGVYTAAYVIYEQLTGNILFVEAPSWVEPAQARAGQVSRLFGLYGDDNAFSLILGLTLPIAFHRFIETPTLGKKVLYATLIVLMLAGEFATFKRAAWLSLVVSLLIIQFFHPGFRRIFMVLALLFAGVFFVAGDQLTDSDVATRATYKIDSANGRTDRWSTAIDLWKQKPLTGHGYKRFDDLSGFEAVESYYLHILVSAGLFAFLPFITFILLTIKDSISIFRQATRNPRLFADRKIIALFWGMLAVYLIISFSNYMATPQNHVLTYALIGGIIGSQSVLLERKKQTDPISRSRL